jgi:hypothetical protein
MAASKNIPSNNLPKTRKSGRVARRDGSFGTDEDVGSNGSSEGFRCDASGMGLTMVPFVNDGSVRVGGI